MQEGFILLFKSSVCELKISVAFCALNHLDRRCPLWYEGTYQLILFAKGGLLGNCISTSILVHLEDLMYNFFTLSVDCNRANRRCYSRNFGQKYVLQMIICTVA